MAREVLGVAGAVIGGIYGGPRGAQIGFMVGSTIGGIIDGPEKIKGPALSEAPVQTSRDGVPIPIIWGLHHCHGNIIIKNAETTKDITTSQGKGGGTKTTETRRFRTFGIGVCRGPISSIFRIWENDVLVYDARTVPAIPAAETTAYGEGIRIYLGDEAQLPDPDLEAHWGVGDTPYFRGLSYIVWVNKDLTDFGGSIPQFRFEVNGSVDATITSKPYPIEALDGLAGAAPSAQAKVYQAPIEGIETEQTPVSGEIMAPLISYNDALPEGILTVQDPDSGVLRVALESYGDALPEGIDTTQDPDSGTIRIALVTYSTGQPEGVATSQTPKSGTLT